MNDFDRVIADLYPTMQKYFPRLSAYLMNLYATEPVKSCQKIHHQYVGLILFSFCNYLRYEKDLTHAFNYAFENLSKEEFLNKSYLGFKDGNLYDKKYSETYLYSLISDAVISFEIPLRKIQKTSKKKMDIFIDYLIKIINHISKHTDINSNLYCAEYLEQCFLYALRNNLEIYYEYQDSLKNK